MNKVAGISLVLVFLWGPFSVFFNSPWAELTFCLLPLFSLLLLILERWEEPGWIKAPPGSNFLLFLIVFGLVQLVPLPQFLVRFLSPDAWSIYQNTVGVLQEGVWVSLSLTPKATLVVVFRLIGCWAAYVAGANFLQEGDRLKTAGAFIAILGGCLAVVLLGFVWLHSAFGTPVGHESLKTVSSIREVALASSFLLLSCPFSWALFLAERPTVRYGSIQERFWDLFFSFKQKGHVLYGLVAVVIPLALFFFWDRGLQILLVGVLLYLVLMALRSSGRKVLTHLFCYVLLIIILVVSSFIRTSFVSQSSVDIVILEDGPQRSYPVSNALTLDFLLSGAGYGSFPSIEQRYGTVPSPDSTGHNTGQGFIRFFSQVGLVGFSATVCFLISFLFFTLRRWWNRRHKLTVYLYPAGLGGILAFIFSYFSFGGAGLYGISLPVFLVLGLTAASARPSSQNLYEEYSGLINRSFMVFVTIAAVFFVIFFNLGELAGKTYYDQARDQVAETQEARELSRKLLFRAMFFDPFNSQYRYAQGYAAMDLANEDIAREYFIEGLSLAPLEAKSLFGLGQYLFMNGNADAGQQLLFAALKNAPFSREIQSAYVEQLVRSGKLGEALRVVRQILETLPQETLFWIQNVTNLGIDSELRPRILPGQSRPYHDYGLFLQQRGDAVKADQFFRQALKFAKREEKPEKSIFLSMVGFFEKHRSFDQALDTLLVAREKYPEDTGFLMASGRVYEEMGITLKAREVYQEVLIIDPTNEDARQRMEALETLY